MTAKSSPHETALRELGSLEARVVTAMWALGGGTVQDVLEQLNADDGNEWAYNTVMTVMARLAEKGLLMRERDGRAYRYAAAVDRRGLAEKQIADRVTWIFETYGEFAWPVILRTAQQAGYSEPVGPANKPT